VSASLSLTDLDSRLTTLAQLRGAGSAPRRAAALGALFAQATHEEQQFLLHLLAGELRQGALEGLMVEAVRERRPRVRVRRAAMYAGSLGSVAHSALTQGSAGIGRCQLELFAPVAPMLAQTAADVGEALRELPGGEVAFEWKLDGARIQVHKRGREVRIYTRALNEVTQAMPEIVELARALAPAELILDGEAIALDANDRPHPLQITMRRFGRKLDVELRGQIALRAFFFDCLRLETRTLADCPTHERFARS
jgi:DNA ligase-1